MTTPVSIEARIFEALCQRLKDSAGSQLIAWPNEAFTPPNDRAYLEVKYSPNVTTRMVIESDGPHRYMGIFQVAVHRALDLGNIVSQNDAGEVATWFAADTKMKNGDLVVRSMGDPSVAESMPRGADLITPVSVEYETYY